MSKIDSSTEVHYGFVDGLVPADEQTGDTAMHVSLVDDGGERVFPWRQTGMPSVGSCVQLVEVAEPDGSFYQDVRLV